jgi:hypothetical protein
LRWRRTERGRRRRTKQGLRGSRCNFPAVYIGWSWRRCEAYGTGHDRRITIRPTKCRRGGSCGSVRPTEKASTRTGRTCGTHPHTATKCRTTGGHRSQGIVRHWSSSSEHSSSSSASHTSSSGAERKRRSGDWHRQRVHRRRRRRRGLRLVDGDERRVGRDDRVRLPESNDARFDRAREEVRIVRIRERLGECVPSVLEVLDYFARR